MKKFCSKTFGNLLKHVVLTAWLATQHIVAVCAKFCCRKKKKIPTTNGIQIVRAFQRDGWIVIRQKGSHVRLQKHTATKTLKLTVPAHRPVKRTTLAHILKQANLSVDEFIRLV